tara:strand:- start:1743 stop:1880 length:138 start_codon:yes stop_codon:yes gene_type:complete
MVTELPSEGGAEAIAGDVRGVVMNRSKVVTKMAISLGFIMSARLY